MATKIIINDTMFTFEEDGLQFDAVIENGRIVTMSNVRDGKMKKPEDKYITNASTVGTSALKTLETAIMAEPQIQAWEVDDFPVTVCKSGAGYYAGCYCDEGPYTRISGYSSGPALVLHWMYKTRVGTADDNDGEDDENGNQNIQDVHLTLGQFANIASKLVGAGEDEPDDLAAQLAELKAVHSALMERMNKAIDCYKKLRSDYKQTQSNLYNANKANEHLRWLLTSNGIAIN